MTNEELVLLIRHCDNKKEYLEALYNQNRGLIAEISKRYINLMEIDDLMQEGSIGLLEAAESYDFESGVKFSSYAGSCIRFHLLNYLRDHGYIVSFPAYLIEKVRKLNIVIDEYYKAYAREPSVSELARILKMPQKQTKELLEKARLFKIKSLNELITLEGEPLELMNCIADPENPYEKVDDRIQNEQLKKVLWGIVDSLEPEQAKIMHMRYEDNKHTKEIANVLGVTACNVRTMENRAIKELKQHRNKKQLKPFFSDDKLYSISLQYSSRKRFEDTWTSAPEQAVLFAEEMRG